MLILTRKPGESIIIGDSILITLWEIKGYQARLGIDAPKTLPVHRDEVYQRILNNHRRKNEIISAGSN